MNPELQVREICDWLAKQLSRANTQGVVVGISGGVDSAVAATLAEKALGHDHVLGLIMPCHSQKEDIDDANLVINHLRLRHELVDLTSIADALSGILPETSEKIFCNIRPRLRMTTLYHYAAAHNYLVLGTSNRSEWEIGYFTKYGDGAADLQPLIHLLKRDVVQLALYLQLPLRIIQKPPSAGLWRGQTDESDIGFTYQELDSYLEGEPLSSEDVRLKIQSMQHTAYHKKQLVPRLPGTTLLMEVERHEHDAYDKSIEALTLISKAITSEQYLEDILRLIVMVTAEVMNSSVCSLWLLDEKEGLLRLRATQSINSEYLKDRTLKVGEGIVGKVIADKRPYIAANVLTDPYYKEKELARSMGLVSMISVPMHVKDRVIGVINCYTSHPHVFSDLQMNVFTAVANQAAVAIENTELMVKTKVIQEELESRKLIERAKDLIMKRLKLSGEEAYRWLQKRSMNTRKSMREVAEAVLLTMEA
jgi:NAD+ synthetase